MTAAPESRASRKSRTRAAILAAASARFTTTGYTGTTIRDIAADAKVAVGTVHAHFPDKHALLLACFHAGIAEAVTRVWSTLDRDAPLLDQLVHCACVLYAAYAEHPALSREMFVAGLFPPDELAEPDLAADFLENIVELYQLALLRDEIQRLPEDPLLVAQSYFANYILVLIGGLSGHFPPAQFNPATDSPTAAAERWAARLRELLELQLEGLGARLREEPA